MKNRYYIEPKTVYSIVDGTTNCTLAPGISLQADAQMVCDALNGIPTANCEIINPNILNSESSMNFHPIENSSDTAKLYVPYFMEWYKPKSVLDLGCNVGWWLYWFNMQGVNDILGVDGSNMKDKLAILPHQFMEADLTKVFVPPSPYKAHTNVIPKKFSLCLCLEVAEHLEQQYADVLVQSCINHSDTIIWSAATPGQGGYHHVNEQPHQYWIDKFAAHGYNATPLIDKLSVAPHDYYRKNMYEFKKQ